MILSDSLNQIFPPQNSGKKKGVIIHKSLKYTSIKSEYTLFTIHYYIIIYLQHIVLQWKMAIFQLNMHIFVKYTIKMFNCEKVYSISTHHRD